MAGLDRNDLLARYGDLSIEVDGEAGEELRIRVSSMRALDLLRRLREDEVAPLVRLLDLTAIDRGRDPGRFEGVYRLDSLDRSTPVRVHAWIEDAAPDSAPTEGAEGEPVLDSVVTLWPVAAWLEREVFDLFGIRFRGHPELRRLLLDEEFEGAPLRKDFPRAGLTPDPSSGSPTSGSAPSGKGA